MSSSNLPSCCPQPATYSQSQSGFFSGNQIQSGFLATQKGRMSNHIQIVSRVGVRGSKQTQFASHSVNAFGRWEGAPIQSTTGKPLRNKF
jgi:hypothetical protein